MKITQKEVQVGQIFVCQRALFMSAEPGGALTGPSGFLPKGHKVVVVKRPTKYDGINCIKFSLVDAPHIVSYAYWIDFREDMNLLEKGDNDGKT